MEDFGDVEPSLGGPPKCPIKADEDSKSERKMWEEAVADACMPKRARVARQEDPTRW
jgi:hypothetical protein